MICCKPRNYTDTRFRYRSVTLRPAYSQTWFKLRLNAYRCSRGNINVRPLLYFLPLKPMNHSEDTQNIIAKYYPKLLES